MRNLTLDALKGLACIGVVFMHVQFPGNFGKIIVALLRVFVPLFFGISGYYLYSENSDTLSVRLIKRTKNIVKITISAFIFYFIWESFVRLIGGGIEKLSYWYRYDLFTWKNLWKLIFFSYDPIVGHLWFLLALIGAYVIFLFINKYRLERRIGSLSIIVLEIHIAIAILFNKWNTVSNIYLLRNVWFYGFPALLFGYWIRKNQKQLDEKISTKILITLIPISMILVLIEYRLVGNLQFYNGSILMMAVLLLLASRFPMIQFPKSIIILGNQYSSKVYIYHWMVMELVIKFKKVTRIQSSYFLWIEPIIVVVLTTLGLIFLSFLQKQWIHKKIQI